jgi:hypothetical protein
MIDSERGSRVPSSIVAGLLERDLSAGTRADLFARTAERFLGED